MRVTHQTMVYILHALFTCQKEKDFDTKRGEGTWNMFAFLAAYICEIGLDIPKLPGTFHDIVVSKIIKKLLHFRCNVDLNS